MIRFTVTLTSTPEEEDAKPDRQAIADLMQLVARRLVHEDPWEGGRLQGPGLEGAWELTIYDLATKTIDADVAAALAEKAAFIRKVLHDVPLAVGEPTTVALTRSDVRTLVTYGMRIGSTMPPVETLKLKAAETLRLKAAARYVLDALLSYSDAGDEEPVATLTAWVEEASTPTPDESLFGLTPEAARQIVDDIDKLGNDASLASKILWGQLNSRFGFYEITGT